MNDQPKDLLNPDALITVEDRIEVRILESEMQNSYLKYAMSVIASRALPDVRDGLKPVHRRIVYVMNKMGLTPNSKFKKSAQIIGEVMGKYHPHGDGAIYEALVRMAQDFSLRYPLVDGQGNFGSMDGDPAAAHRYTEARMNKPATFLVSDIEKETVDFLDNYDGSQQEPKVLPSRIPNLIINGVTGIAVGMATSIPPHNLGEVSMALLALLDDPDLTIEGLMEYIKGPDLPTAAIIYGKNDILNAYKTGRGKCVIRARAVIEDQSLIITEIPWQLNKSTLIEKIANLIKEKKIEGVRDLRDESNKEGVRIVVECKRDITPEVILNQLYKNTDLQMNLHFNLLALVNDGRQPKLLNLKEILVEFLNHRHDVVTRRTKFELKKAKAELHILEGLKIALDFIDEVIKLIRSSADKTEAAGKLVERFKFTDIQTEAILQMRLQTLTNLDKAKIDDRLEALKGIIIELDKILNDPKVKIDLIKSEINEANEKLSSKRRTEIIEYEVGNHNKENFVEEEEVLVQLTNEMYLKVLPIDTFRTQGRGGRGLTSFNAKDTDWVKSSFIANSHDYVYAFSSGGRVFKSRVFDLPSGSRTGRGQNLINYFELKNGEKITNLLTLTKLEEENGIGYLIFATSDGIVKKTSLAEYANARKNGLIAINLRENSQLIDVQYNSKETDMVILSANNGKTVIFDCGSISSTGRTSMGVRGMKLKKNEQTIALQIIDFTFQADEDEISET